MNSAVEEVSIQVSFDSLATGRAAAAAAAAAIAGAINARGSARVIFGSAPSQETMLAALTGEQRVDWSRVHGFHMDEYVSLPPEHPQAFGQWLVDRLPTGDMAAFERILPGADPQAEARRYAALLSAAPVDLTLMGFGVNGHIAFNEPGDARLDDPDLVRLIGLDEVTRKQQVDDGLFPTAGHVPAKAVTLTVPALLSAAVIVVTVLGEHKAATVASALTGPVDTTACPGSAVRTHPAVRIHLDRAAASRLPATS